MRGRSSFEWEREEDPPTDDEEKMELVVDIPTKKREVSDPVEVTVANS